VLPEATVRHKGRRPRFLNFRAKNRCKQSSARPSRQHARPSTPSCRPIQWLVARHWSRHPTPPEQTVHTRTPLCFAHADRRTAAVPFDSDSFPIAIDPCATTSFTNDIRDFRTKVPVTGEVRGVGKAPIRWKGDVVWSWLDDHGRKHEFHIRNVILNTDLPFRLFAPHAYAQQEHDAQGTGSLSLGDKTTLFWRNRQYQRTVPLDESNIPMMWSTPGNKQYKSFAHTIEELPPLIPNYVSDDEDDDDASISEPPPLIPNGGTDNDDDELEMPPLWRGGGTDDNINNDNINNTDPAEQPIGENREGPIVLDLGDDEQREHTVDEADLTVSQHQLLKIHHRLGHISMKRLKRMAQLGLLPKHLATTPEPMCASCQYRKATRRPWRTKGQAKQANKMVTINKPGDCVSVDQLESPTPGFIGQIKGILTIKRYQVATIFIDHKSRLGFVYLQHSTGAVETVEAKKAFEAYARSHGVTVRHYHADNGRFAENLWLAHCNQQQQSVTFCGVGAHFQNGVAEKRIRDLQESARTMMMRAADKWQVAQSTALWPYAIRLANEALNCTPRRDDVRESPIEIFTGSRVRPNLKHLHHHGCPAYVLKAALQSAGGSQKKWDPRARLGIYLGPSPKHARGVSLVLNPRTGLVSPQWHVKHDDFFETVSGKQPDETHGQWKKLSGLTKVDGAVTARRTSVVTKGRHPSDGRTIGEQPALGNISEPEGERGDDDFGGASEELFPEEPGVKDIPPLMGTPVEPEAAGPPRRSTRIRTPTRKMLESVAQQDYALSASVQVANNEMYLESCSTDGMDDPFAFAASKSDPDTMYYHQAVKQPDAKEFKKAMQKEIDDHVENNHWEMVDRKSIPEGTKVLDSVWAMKRKRRIKTREVYKWKARLNVHGGQMLHGIHYWETFSPVVTWMTIRLVLILSILLAWHTRQVDFVLAYPQAPVQAPIYMEIPKGVHKKGGGTKDSFLHLIRNLYGARDAGRIWNRYLHDGLIDLGFVQSQVDECCYFRNRTIFLVYVDDGILAGPDKEEIDLIIKQLGEKYKITDEGDITDYLGVNVDKLPDGRVKLSQPHLIDQIIKDVNFRKETKCKSTPAPSTVILNKDEDGEHHDAEWNYRAIIGKLNFLEKSTRGELGYSVHQAARFSQSPRKSHTEAVLRIIRYLVGTRDEGIILDPKEENLRSIRTLTSRACGAAKEQNGIRAPPDRAPDTSFDSRGAQSSGPPNYRPNTASRRRNWSTSRSAPL
jgi:hypothetical protein